MVAGPDVARLCVLGCRGTGVAHACMCPRAAGTAAGAQWHFQVALPDHHPCCWARGLLLLLLPPLPLSPLLAPVELLAV